MVKNAEDAKSAIEAMRYPPHGHRGVSLHRGAQFGETFTAYQEWLETHSVCVVQIEHIDAIDNLSRFSRLTVSTPISSAPTIYLPLWDSPVSWITQMLLPRSKQSVRLPKMRSPEDFYIVEPNQQKLDEAIQSGFTFLAYSIDTMIIRNAYTNMIAPFQGNYRDFIMSNVAIIPARMGSLPLLANPWLLIEGIPMIGHVYMRTRMAQSLTDCWVATCDTEIKTYIESIGGKAVMTADTHDRCSTGVQKRC